ncbi:MAG: tautomerase family protein [Pseudomonadota bacterium]
MPVIIVKARKGVLKTREIKAALIKDMAQCFARAVNDEAYAKRATVIIEEVPDENWGRNGEQIQS